MRQTRLKQYLAVAAVFSLVIFLNRIGALKPLKSAISRAINPLMSNLYSLSSKAENFYRFETDRQKFFDDLAALQGQAADCSIDQARLETLEEENKSLRSFLKFEKDPQTSYLVANVISRSEFATGELTLMINRGQNDGVYPGLIAVTEEGVVAGKVSEVRENVSVVVLTTNSDCRLAASVLNSTKTIGVASGNLGLTVEMNLIPQTEIVAPGQIVITSGLEENIPRGKVIGRITEVRKENNEIWQSAVIEPVVNLNSMTILAVVMPVEKK